MSIDKLNKAKLIQNGTQSTVLKTIRDFAPISRSGIVEKTGLPHAATSRSVNCLLEDGVITESALTDTNGPRRKRGLRLNPEKGYCISIEYSADGIEGVAFNSAYEKFAEEKQKISLKTAPKEDKIEQIANFLRTFNAKIPKKSGICLGIALVDPGMIDENNGIAISSTTLDDWENVPIVQTLESMFNIPVTLLNTSISKIRAIDRLELEGVVDNFMYIEYGAGIGCGLKLAGQYICGRNNLAGELGHMRVTDAPISCKCGGMGCLESVAAIPALIEHAQSALVHNSNSLLVNAETLNGTTILEAAAKGDRLASHIIDEAFDYLGRAVAGLINVINPSIIVFDNIINKAGDDSVAALKRSLKKNTLASHWENLDIKVSSIDSFIGPLGAAAAVLDNCMES